jgi:hypothetical protein
MNNQNFIPPFSIFSLAAILVGSRDHRTQFRKGPSKDHPKGHVSYCHHWASVVRPLTFHILINSSEATGSIWTKLWWNGPWMKEMKSNYLSFCEYLTKIPPPPTFRRGGIKKWLSPTTCHYQIFDENQNPVDMHTSIMCINIVQNIKAVAEIHVLAWNRHL